VRSARKSVNPSGGGDAQSVRAAAIALLARRDVASAKLGELLERRGCDTAIVPQVIAELADEGLVNDARFAENRVAYQAARGQGPLRIGAQLRALGLSAVVIEEALRAGPDWHVLARETRQRKFGRAVPDRWALRARQARFLQYRGFSADHIRSALGPDFDPDTTP
jgi:regulatory protein